MKPTISLIISTYNWPQALDLCIQSIINQKRSPDELIIADDGSDRETLKVVEKYSALLPLPVKHVWHEDEGFRLAEIRNKAIHKSDSEYLVFVDGDTILHRNFISDHLYYAKKDCFITGSRVLITEQYTNSLLKGNEFHFRIISDNFINRLNGVRFNKLADIYLHTSKRFLDVRGCNMSFWKKDLFLVDGFDQQFRGWGREDSDLVIRLINAGKTRLKLKFAANQYHLYHPHRSKESIEQNNRILANTITLKRVRAVKGISLLNNS